MGGKRKSKLPEHITFPYDRLWQALLTSTLFTVFQKLMLPLAPNFAYITFTYIKVRTDMLQNTLLEFIFLLKNSYPSHT